MAATREINLRAALEDVLEAIRPYTQDDEAGRPWLKAAREALAVYNAPDSAEVEAYREAAQEEYGSDEIEIDEDAVVSVGEGGAFVQAWVYVYDESDKNENEEGDNGNDSD